MQDLSSSNNEIILKWTPEFLERVQDAERGYGIKHFRTKDQPKHKAKFRKEQGDINKISIGLTKGLIMSYKGKGKSNDNRVAKPAYNDVAEVMVEELADSIMINTGDIIGKNFMIR